MNFGKNNQVYFANDNEYFYALGYLANNNHAEVYWEHNEDQGAWGSEGRIHCLVPPARFPQNFTFTAGKGSVYARINCNDYVGVLVRTHHFAINGALNNYATIISTVPSQYHADFIAGYNAL